MSGTYDLFISYSSFDRPWALRLKADLLRDYPTLNIFFDRSSLPLGESFRGELRNGAISTRFLVALWSDKSRESDEVRDEVASFQVYSGSLHIPMFLQGTYTPAQETEGLDAVSKTGAYDPTADDRGTTKLDGPGLSQREWRFDIRKLGDTVANTLVTTQPVLLAILAMPKDWLEDLRTPQRRLPDIHRLDYYLEKIGLKFEDLEARYGENAFAWQPFGDGLTVIEVLERFRVETNRNIEGKGFHWKPLDLVSRLVEFSDDAGLTNFLSQLNKGPSVVVLDPVSLYHNAVQTLVLKLNKYMESEYSTVVSFSPIHRPGVDVLFKGIRARSNPLLERYFAPEIPPVPGTFARCGINLDSAWELERLIRWRLGTLEAERRLEEAKHATSMGG